MRINVSIFKRVKAQDVFTLRLSKEGREEGGGGHVNVRLAGVSTQTVCAKPRCRERLYFEGLRST